MTKLSHLLNIYAHYHSKDSLLDNIRQYFPNVELTSANEFLSWLDSIIPVFVQNKIVDRKSLKQCGTISYEFGVIANKAGFPTLTYESMGHVVNVVLTQDGSLGVDFSHLQFKFQHGGLRDFDRSEIGGKEYLEMKELFDKLQSNPKLAVKITKLSEDIIYMYLEIPKPNGIWEPNL